MRWELWVEVRGKEHLVRTTDRETEVQRWLESSMSGGSSILHFVRNPGENALSPGSLETRLHVG